MHSYSALCGLGFEEGLCGRIFLSWQCLACWLIFASLSNCWYVEIRKLFWHQPIQRNPCIFMCKSLSSFKPYLYVVFFHDLISSCCSLQAAQMGSGALAVALPFSIIIGLLASITSLALGRDPDRLFLSYLCVSHLFSLTSLK